MVPINDEKVGMTNLISNIIFWLRPLFRNVLIIIPLLAVHMSESILYAEPFSSQKPEIHLLVDVSGSMKKTDPQNLRVPAIKMFLYLINQKAVLSITKFC